MADTFADGIVPVAAPSFSGLLTQPDPMLFAPKPGLGTRVLDTLAGGFGQGPDRTGAYIKGLTAGSEYRLRSAQTDSALAEADKRRGEAVRQTQINDAITKAQSDPNFQPDLPFYAALAANANDMSNAALHNQEYNRNTLIADPHADPAAVSAARAASAPGSYHQYYQPATGMIANEASAAAPTVTPVGQATIDSTTALADLRNQKADAISVTPTGPKAPAGYRYAADGQTLEVIPGGPHDPNASAPQGAREAVFTNRVLAGAAQSVAAMKNIMRMPVGASTGVLGIGSAPGKGIFESAKNALRNKVTDTDVQQYVTALSGLSRNLAAIETQGLAPSGSFIGSLDALQLRAGDDQFTKLVKLAEVRQTVEAGLEPLMNSPRVPPQTKQYAQSLISNLQQTIPFTWEDVQTLQKSPNGEATLGDLLKQKGGTPSAAPGVGGAPPAPGAVPGQVPAGVAIHNTSKSGKPIISKDGGKTWEYE